jgi:hypothetical protein
MIWIIHSLYEARITFPARFRCSSQKALTKK